MNVERTERNTKREYFTLTGIALKLEASITLARGLSIRYCKDIKVNALHKNKGKI